MKTLSQYQEDDQIWSLEEDHGELFLMHVTEDGPRITIPFTFKAWDRLRDEGMIVDERQKSFNIR